MSKALSGVVVVIVLVIAGRAADAQPVEKGTFGVGLVIGEPTGIAAKLYLDDDHAIQGAIGGAFIGGGIVVQADYLWHPWILEDRDSFTLPVYLGPGVRVIDYRGGRDEDFFAAGLRAVAGILFDFKEVPLDVFIELAGVVEWQFGTIDDEQGPALAVEAGLGARYYF